MVEPTRRLDRVGVLLGIFYLLSAIFSDSVKAESPGSVQPTPPGTYSFKAFGPDQGLINTTVSSLACDPNGRIWVGTEGGLFRLDGERFRQFGTEDGLPCNYVTALVAPQDGGLWVITQLGLAFFDGREFRRPSERGIPDTDQYATSLVTREDVIPIDGLGLLFIKGDVPRLATGQPGFRPLPVPPKLSSGSVWASPDGRELFLATDRELIEWREGKIRRRSLSKSLTGSRDVLTLMRDRKGILWIRTREALLRLEDFDASPEVVSVGVTLGSTNYGVDLREDFTGRIWTSTTRGLFWFQDGQRGWLNETNGLPETGGSFRFVFDKEGNLWVATESLLMQQGRFLWSNYSRRQGLPANLVWRIARGPDGRLWAFTQSGLAKAGEQGWITMPGTASRQFYTLALDPEGSIWIGGANEQNETPVLWELRSGQAWPRPVPLLGIFGPVVVWEIAFEPAEDGLWLATREKGLLFGQRRLKGWQMRRISIPGWKKNELDIRAMTRGPEGTLWVGGHAGLAIKDGNRWQVFRPGQEIPRAMVAILSVSPQGEVWAAYGGCSKEITVFVKQQGHWQVGRRYRYPHPLVHDQVLAIDFEPDGTLMLGTHRGVKRWDGRKIERYGHEWGLAGEDCSQCGLWLDPNGDWWVGTSAGISRFERARYREQPPLCPVGIQRVIDGRGRNLLDNGNNKLSSIAHRHAYLTFHFYPQGQLCKAASTVQIRLRGIEDRWRTAESLSAVYPALSAGQYVFEVRQQSWDKKKGPLSAFAFEILPPWYNTWWAKSALGLVAIGIAWFLYRLRILHLRRKTERLEALVSARTVELAAQARDLELSNTRLSEANVDLIKALAEVKTLRGLVPICSYCKKIRNDQGFWSQLESYLSQHTEADFSHGICPDCVDKVRAELRMDIK